MATQPETTSSKDVAEIEYKVTWVVDVCASSPEEAARKARGMQLRQDSIADVFIVENAEGRHDVDLSELDGRCVD